MKKSKISFITYITIIFVILTLFNPMIDIGKGDDLEKKSPLFSFLQSEDVILAIDVNEASDNDYDAAFQLALSAGMQATSLSLQWDQIEVSPYGYQDPYSFLEISNIYYPAYGIPLDLMIGPIDTVANRMPEDLQDKPFNDPEVIMRYNNMIEFALSKIPDVQLVSFSIGNEIDFYLDNDEKWDEYIEFFQQTRQHIKTLIPDVPIGSKASFDGYVNTDTLKLEELNQFSDGVFVTYYPLESNYDVKDPSVVYDDFDTITSMFQERDIYFHEVGYPSSSKIKSSESKQSEFIEHLFHAWEEHVPQIKYVNINWLYDISEETLEEYRQYYGSSNPGFLEYLATLGMRHHEGAAKTAFITLKNITNPENRPNKPLRPLGTTSGKIGNEYIYNTSTTDPDGNQIFYKWDWGDKTFSDWLGPYDSGETISVIHTWQDVGDYDVRVYAKNTNDIESEWSDLLPVGMPKNKAANINPLFLRFLEQHPSMLPILRYLLRL
jgi:hypothetical protein